MDPIVIGKRIRNLRGEKSRKILAKELGISKSAISMYERGERVPRDEVKVKISNYFGVPVELIFFAPDEHK